MASHVEELSYISMLCAVSDAVVKIPQGLDPGFPRAVYVAHESTFGRTAISKSRGLKFFGGIRQGCGSHGTGLLRRELCYELQVERGG